VGQFVQSGVRVGDDCFVHEADTSPRRRVWPPHPWRRVLPPIAFLSAFVAFIASALVLSWLGASESVAVATVPTAVVIGLGWTIFIFGTATDRHGKRPPITARDRALHGQLLATVFFVYGVVQVAPGVHGRNLDADLGLMGTGFFLWSIFQAGVRSRAAGYRSRWDRTRDRHRPHGPEPVFRPRWFVRAAAIVVLGPVGLISTAAGIGGFATGGGVLPSMVAVAVGTAAIAGLWSVIHYTHGNLAHPHERHRS
jgi:hypothetical protein